MVLQFCRLQIWIQDDAAGPLLRFSQVLAVLCSFLDALGMHMFLSTFKVLAEFSSLWLLDWGPCFFSLVAVSQGLVFCSQRLPTFHLMLSMCPFMLWSSLTSFLQHLTNLQPEQVLYFYDYTGPTWIYQGNLPILKSLINHLNSTFKVPLWIV